MMFTKTNLTLFLLLFYCSSSFSQVIFQENFDNKVFPPAGWINKRTLPSVSLTDNLWERVSISNSPKVATHSGDGMAFFNSYSYAAGTKTELVTSSIDLSSGGPYTLKFWMYRDGNFTFNADVIEVFFSNIAEASGTLLGTIARSYDQSPIVASPGWYQYSFSIPASYNTNQNYAIFRATSATGNNIIIDDIEIAGSAVNPCHGPINFNFTGIATTSADVSWSSYLPNNANSYDWEIRTSGRGGSGAGGLVTSGNTTNLFATANGLTSNTDYAYYIRGNCGAENSIWSGPYNFKTACTINTVPFSENFDNVTAPLLPNCFSVENRNSGNTWVNTNLGSSSFSAYSSPNAIVYASQTRIEGDDWIYTPALSLKNAVNYRMRFWYKSLFAGFSNQIEIKVGKAPTASAMTSNVLYSNTSINSTSFQEANFSFTVPDSSVYYIGIHCITPTGAYNYQMLLDNFRIDIGPNPNCGTIVNPHTDSIGFNNAVIKWAIPSSGTAVNYDWELRTSGAAGSGSTGLYSSGNTISIDSILLTGLSMGSSYTFYAKTNCISPSYGFWSTGVQFTTKTTVCSSVINLTSTNLKKDGFRGYWSVGPITSQPVSYEWEVRTSGNAGSGSIGLIASGNTTNQYFDIAGLQPITFYNLSVRVHCISGNFSSWASSSVTTLIENDICADATELSVGNWFSTDRETARLDLASPSEGLSNSCALLTNGSGTTNTMKDAWYKLKIPETGNVIVQTYSVLTASPYNFGLSTKDNMLIAYSGECGNLTEIACDLNSAPDDYWGLYKYHAKITLTNRIPGETIYIRLLPDAINSPYIFFSTAKSGLSAWDNTNLNTRPPVSPGGNCRSNQALNFGIYTDTDNYFTWNPIFDSDGKIIAELSPNNPLGTVTPIIHVDTAQSLRTSTSGRYVLNRSLSFSVQSPSYSYSPYLRIYYKKEELQKLKIIDPSAEFDFMEVIQTNSSCNNGVFSGTETILTPLSYGTYGDDYYVELNVSSLGNFYLTSNNSTIQSCSGSVADIVSEVSGSNYKWQVDSGFGFVNIVDDAYFNSSATKTLKVNSVPATFNNFKFRCYVDGYKYSKTYKLKILNEWTGAVNNKWENGGNWSCGSVPDKNTDVKINTGDIVVESSTATCRSIIVKPGVQISMAAGSNLTIVD